MMRVTTFSQQTRSLDSMLDIQRRVYDTNTQISSGKVAQNFAGIAGDAERTLGLRAEATRIDNYLGNVTSVDRRLTLVDQSLETMSDVASSLRTTLMQATSDGLKDAVPLKEQAEGMLQTVISALNVSEDGRFLFSGSRTDTAPVTNPVPDPLTFGVAEDTYYTGDDIALSARLDDAMEMTYGMTADRQAFQDLIGSLKAAIHAADIGSTATAESALTMVNDAIGKLADYRAEVGANQARLDKTMASHEDRLVVQNEAIASIENTDIPSAAIRMASEQTLLDASYMMVSQVNRMSLADYLK
ncbi:flagellin [Tistrella bauzanensis]|uniref:Flagellin n=1 Tax=Tistrella arctica TaxID=3133430 RepID=A0ABU9YID6_9PROT